jgi:hypothetical protein
MAQIRGVDFQIMMPNKEFEATHDLDGAIDAAVRYFNFLVPVNKDGLTPAELGGSLSTPIADFINNNKEKRYNKVVELDTDFFTAMTLQKIMNEYLLNTNKTLEKRLGFLSSLKNPGERNPLYGGKPVVNTLSSRPFSMKLDDFLVIMRLMAFLKHLEESDFRIKFMGLDITVTQSVDGMDGNPIDIQFFHNRKDQPVKVTTTLCTLTLVGKKIYVKFANQFRKDLFYHVLEKTDVTEVLKEALVKSYAKLGDKEKQVPGNERVNGRRSREMHSGTGIDDVYQLRVAIKGISPPIWRKLLVGSSTTLHDLHLIIQAAFGWYNYHLYVFIIGGEHYTDPEQRDDEFPDEIDSRQTKLGQLGLREGSAFSYTYDFGDDWEHSIQVQKVLSSDQYKGLPSCIGGKRNCPPEDCGGTYGYENMLRIVSDPADPEHESTLEWLGEYDPEEFDLESTNEAVRNYESMET